MERNELYEGMIREGMTEADWVEFRELIDATHDEIADFTPIVGGQMALELVSSAVGVPAQLMAMMLTARILETRLAHLNLTMGDVEKMSFEEWQKIVDANANANANADDKYAGFQPPTQEELDSFTSLTQLVKAFDPFDELSDADVQNGIGNIRVLLEQVAIHSALDEESAWAAAHQTSGLPINALRRAQQLL